jgi:hypothetical protein
VRRVLGRIGSVDQRSRGVLYAVSKLRAGLGSFLNVTAPDSRDHASCNNVASRSRSCTLRASFGLRRDYFSPSWALEVGKTTLRRQSRHSHFYTHS